LETSTLEVLLLSWLLSRKAIDCSKADSISAALQSALLTSHQFGCIHPGKIHTNSGPVALLLTAYKKQQT